MISNDNTTAPVDIDELPYTYELPYMHEPTGIQVWRDGGGPAQWDKTGTREQLSQALEAFFSAEAQGRAS